MIRRILLVSAHLLRNKLITLRAFFQMFGENEQPGGSERPREIEALWLASIAISDANDCHAFSKLPSKQRAWLV